MWNNPFEFNTFDREEIFADMGELDRLNLQFEQNDNGPFIDEVIDSRGKLVSTRQSKKTYALVKKRMEAFSELFN